MTPQNRLKSHFFINQLQDTIVLKMINLVKSVNILINLESKNMKYNFIT